MVDIVQSNISKLLIRKIGYSVGLELTLKRVRQLVELYVDEKQISNTSWRSLVTDTYKRKETQTKHFENFFDVIGVMTVSSGRPIPQQIIDVCALLKNYFEDEEEKYENAIKSVLLFSIILSDGELFTSLLATEFDERLFVDRLTKFRTSKLKLFYEKYPSSNLKNKLHRIINFEEMTLENNKTKATSLSGMMTPPFANNVTSKNQQDPDDFEVSLSDDWYRKIPPLRQRWSEDLGLYEGKKLTAEGQRFIANIRSLLSKQQRKYLQDDDSIIIMPTDLEMMSSNVTWLLDDDLLINFNDLLTTINAAYIGDGVSDVISNDDLIENILPFCFKSYISADVRFTKLRRELPYTTLALFCLGYSVAEKLNIGDLEKILIQDKRNKINYIMRKSRKSMHGIFLKD